ncbi:MAG: hypothetical protein WCE44_14285 [Candidatus Velthaea sp.]|jgi:hypothetical protein
MLLAFIGSVIFFGATPPPLKEWPSDTVLARYAAALADYEAPAVLSFDYTLEQSGAREGEQSHRVFRSATNERDETLAVDGRKLDPPTVRIFRGRANRYTVELLAPRPAQYGFRYLGTHRDGHHLDYVFDATIRGEAAYRVTRVTIDGVTFLPQTIVFSAGTGGTGTVTFGRSERWWIPLEVTAHARIGGLAAVERLTFSAYRFPATLPPSTFAMPRPLPATTPAAPP